MKLTRFTLRDLFWLVLVTCPAPALSEEHPPSPQLRLIRVEGEAVEIGVLETVIIAVAEGKVIREKQVNRWSYETHKSENVSFYNAKGTPVKTADALKRIASAGELPVVVVSNRLDSPLDGFNRRYLPLFVDSVLIVAKPDVRDDSEFQQRIIR